MTREPSRAGTSKAQRAKPLPLVVPGWFRALVPAEIQLSAAAVDGGRVRLVLGFPRELSVTVELGPVDESCSQWPFVSRDFAIMYLEEGSSSREHRARVCRSLGNRLKTSEGRVVSWLRDAYSLSRVAKGDDGSCPQDPRLRAVWVLERAIRQITDDDEEAPMLDSLEAEVDKARLPILAHLHFASGEPLRAMALIDDDNEGGHALLVRGIAAALVGDDERVRSLCERLVGMAHRPSIDFDLLTAVGSLAMEAHQLDIAFACFRELSDARGLPSDIVRALRALMQNEQNEETFSHMARELIEGRRQASGGVAGLAKLCEDAGHYELATAASRLWLKNEGASVVDPKAMTEARLRLARLAVWRLDLHEAEAHLETLDAENEPEVLRLRAIITYLEGRPLVALETFDLLRARWPHLVSDAETQLWRGEALLALECFEEAEDAVAKAFDMGNSFAALLLQARVELTKRAKAQPEPLPQSPGAPSSIFCPELHELLQFEAAPEVFERAKADPRRGLRLVDEMSRSLGGNRGRIPTRIVEERDGLEKLERWKIPPNARQAASKLQRRLRFETPSTVLRGFEELADRFPSSPFPFTYKGEIRLWLGDYDGAFADFEEALRRQPTRWAYIGMAAGHMLLGDEARASKLTAEGVAQFGQLATATTHVYRGELRRRQGDHEAAIADLELAVEQRPSRVAARMNLAMSYAQLGREGDAARELSRALLQAPGIFWIAANSLRMALPTNSEVAMAIPLFEHALELMRGNRSSWLYSIFDGAGRFCIVPAPGAWTELARQTLPLAERALWEDLVTAREEGK